MSYVVLARKWRPRHFDDVVGQGHVARTLKNSIEEDRVAHAYLFAGARGVGKTSMARILAKALNCEQGPTSSPCYECDSCEQITEGQSVDVFEIDGASNRGINEIRELREGVRYAPSRDRFKIYIIDEVHMLTTEAFNALLKTLEEPPDHAHFVFATTEPQKIPVTILSRCQRFDFQRITQGDIVEHLQFICDREEFDVERGALQLIARQANGGMRDGISLLDQVVSFAGNEIGERQVQRILGIANREHLFELSEAVLDRDAEAALSVLDSVDRYGYDLQQFASEVVSHFRDLAVLAVVDQPAEVTELTERELETARAQIEGSDPKLLHRYFHAAVEGAEKMAYSSYPKLILEMTLVQLTQFEPLAGLDLIVDRLEQLEDELEGQTPAPKKKVNKSPVTSRKTQASTEQIEPGESDGESLADPTTEASSTEAESDTSEESGGGKIAFCRSADAEQKWQALVTRLHQRDYGHLAGICEHGYIQAFGDEQIEIALPEKYVNLLDENRLSTLQSLVEKWVGLEWSVSIERHEPEEGEESEGKKTLAEKRDAEVRRKRQTLEKELTENPVVKKAQKIFDPERVRTRVELYDD